MRGKNYQKTQVSFWRASLSWACRGSRAMSGWYFTHHLLCRHKLHPHYHHNHYTIISMTILPSLSRHHTGNKNIQCHLQECKLNFNSLHGAVSTFKGWRPPWSTLLSVHHRWECIAPALFWRTARIIILGLKCARRITQSAWSSPQLPPPPHSTCSWWWDLETNPGWSLSGLDPLDWVEFLQSDLWGRVTASGKI